MESIRHQGHIAEHPLAGNYSWGRASYAEGFASYPSDGSPSTSSSWPLQDDGQWEPPTVSGDSSLAFPSEADSYYDEDGWMACSHCGAYEDDEDGEELGARVDDDFFAPVVHLSDIDREPLAQGGG